MNVIAFRLQVVELAYSIKLDHAHYWGAHHLDEALSSLGDSLNPFILHKNIWWHSFGAYK